MAGDLLELPPRSDSDSSRTESSVAAAAVTAIDSEHITLDSAFVADAPVRSLVLVRFVCVHPSLRAAQGQPLGDC